MELDALRNAKPLPAAGRPEARIDDGRMGQLEEENVRLQSELDKAEAASREYGTELDTTGAKLEAALSKLDAATAKLKAAEAAQRAVESGSSDHEEDVARLERQLSERGGEVRRLQRDLTTLERLGRELLSDLEERGQSGPDGDALKTQLDALAQSNARREADLEAARWTIAALEGQLSGTGGQCSC